jgi:hypothetical protein
MSPSGPMMNIEKNLLDDEMVVINAKVAFPRQKAAFPCRSSPVPLSLGGLKPN